MLWVLCQPNGDWVLRGDLGLRLVGYENLRGEESGEGALTEQMVCLPAWGGGRGEEESILNQAELLAFSVFV